MRTINKTLRDHKLSDNLMQCPINLQVNCDWNRIRRIYNRLIEKRYQGYFVNEVYEEEYCTHVHSINRHGAITCNTTLTNHDWHMWIGTFLEHIITDNNVKELSKKLLDAKINFKNFGYFIHYGDINEHIDVTPKEVTESLPFKHATPGSCNLNYIISSTDQNAYTYLRDPSRGIEERYPSIVGTTNLLDPEVFHGVKNEGTREVFQIKILSPYNQVKEFLSENGLLL